MSPGNSHGEDAMAPLVSVIMPVYNGERYLAEAIESILTQTLSDLELIVVDDCSMHGSAAIVRDYASRDERVRLIQHDDRDRGSASARNSGIAVARGEFIAAIDSDDISLPRRLEKQAAFLQSHPDIGVVGSFVQTASADLSERQCHTYPQQHAFIVLEWILGGRTTMHGGAYIARRAVLQSVGGYEESRIVTDDKELYSRLFLTTRFANLPAALYVYRLHAHQKSQTIPEEQQSEAFAIRQRWLKRVAGNASPATLERFERLHWSEKFGWREWWLLRRDIKRLLKGMVAAQVLVGCDIASAETEMRKRLESATPRWWQMFLHWRRHHFARGR